MGTLHETCTRLENNLCQTNPYMSHIMCHACIHSADRLMCAEQLHNANGAFRGTYPAAVFWKVGALTFCLTYKLDTLAGMTAAVLAL